MKTAERMQDIYKLGTFESGEIEQAGELTTDNLFKSIEYYLIIHFTNEELFYLPEETERTYEEGAEEVHDTEKGRIYLFT